MLSFAVNKKTSRNRIDKIVKFFHTLKKDNSLMCFTVFDYIEKIEKARTVKKKRKILKRFYDFYAGVERRRRYNGKIVDYTEFNLGSRAIDGPNKIGKCEKCGRNGEVFPKYHAYNGGCFHVVKYFPMGCILIDGCDY